LARPLTKTKTDGSVYRRPPEVEAQIDEALRLAPPDLLRRVQIKDRDDAGYLCPEVLVHLLRRELPNPQKHRDQALMNVLVQTLTARCNRTLLVTVPDDVLPNAADVRDKIWDDLLDLFFGEGCNPDDLDIYECRFNMALRTLRIDAVRSTLRRREKVIALGDLAPAEAGTADGDEEILAMHSDDVSLPPPQDREVLRIQLFEAIEALPADEYWAYTLVRLLGYKEESGDPDEMTAAKRCNCSGRTIRNRLKRAEKKLAHFFSEE
jgi:hypothetical protein